MTTLEKLINSKPFIVAEVGSNWSNLQDCLDSVASAKRSGANAVKFQMFDYTSLYGYHPTTTVERQSYWGRKYSEEIPLRPLHGGIPREWVEPLWEKCKAQEIEFMCTPFSLEDAEFLDPFVNYHKVASSDLEFKELFEVLKSFNKPILFSTGGHTDHDVERVLTLLGSVPSVIMYCVSSYPAKTINTDNIKRLREKFKNFVGFSDHSLSTIDIPRSAYRQGAIVIEKHFKLRDMNTPDNPHSINPDEFSEMVRNIRTEPTASLMTSEEKDMVLMYNRRLIVTRAVEEGERFVLGYNYGPYRSLTPNGGGLSAWLAEDINGKLSRYSYNIGDHITADAVII